jgi:hypothetical protein
MKKSKQTTAQSVIKNYKGIKYAETDKGVFSGKTGNRIRLRYDNKNRITSITNELVYMDIHYGQITTFVAVLRKDCHILKSGTKFLMRMVDGVIKTITINDRLIDNIKYNKDENKYSFELDGKKYSFTVNLAMDIILLYSIYIDGELVALHDITQMDETRNELISIRSPYDKNIVVPEECIVEEYSYSVMDGMIKSYNVKDINTNEVKKFVYKYAKDLPKGSKSTATDIGYFVDISQV